MQQKNGTEVTFNLWFNEINFPHKLLLTDTQVSKILKVFTNGSSANIKLSKTQLSKMLQSGGFIHDILIFGNILSSVAKKRNRCS